MYTKKADKCDIILNLYHSGKTYAELSSEYGISHSALAKWIKQYSEIKIDDETVVHFELLHPSLIHLHRRYKNI